MKLTAYIAALNEIAHSHPNALLMDVVYSVDEEGNRFQPVHYVPSVGYYEDGEFFYHMSIQKPSNAVCVN
ncbi:MAG: hypothetical protein ACPH5P_00275 [Akkermansiaceae bacterium]